MQTFPSNVFSLVNFAELASGLASEIASHWGSGALEKNSA